MGQIRIIVTDLYRVSPSVHYTLTGRLNWLPQCQNQSYYTETMELAENDVILPYLGYVPDYVVS